MKRIFFWLCLIVCLCNTSIAQSCDCNEISQQEAFDEANLIFDGVVVRVNTNWMSGGWKYTFKINQSWKRSTDQVLIINSPWKKDCGYIFKEGKRYLVYVRKKFSMKTYQCIGNMEFEEEHERLSSLGPSFEPSTSTQYGSILWIMSGMAALAMLALAFVVLRKKIRPVRR